MTAILLGDIGGTNARFALLSEGLIGPVDRHAVADYASVKDAIAAFLASRSGASGHGTSVRGAVLAVAAPVEGERSAFTNSRWVVDAVELRAAFGLERVLLVNDFEAVSSSLPHLGPKDVLRIGGGTPLAGAPLAVLGPGTGLGVGALVPSGDGYAVVPTEGGHATLPTVTEREDAVLAEMRRRFGHVSAERALSGMGLENLYAAIAALDGAEVATRSAPDITKLALEGACPTCRAALAMFCALLGTVAGDLALMFRARGGVFVAGGIVPRFTALFADSEFRTRFEAKGRFRPYLQEIPTSVIVHPTVAFIGLSALARGHFDVA
ncbi:Glucokinase [Rhodovulum sp. PH10]|uniref:glucokinase n=1 Tax=Rhodovulum sp. PH10 TaxID=1187851 RepID=UPI00027C2135|nr:glucokinase [Rhodovulum sp. PH10]EJW09336.1 Glucokinase [Rhodovulum sp. PH10]